MVRGLSTKEAKFLSSVTIFASRKSLLYSQQRLSTFTFSERQPRYGLQCTLFVEWSPVIGQYFNRNFLEKGLSWLQYIS